MGDIMISGTENLNEYHKTILAGSYQIEQKKTKNGYDVIFEYNIPGNIDTDTAIINCGTYFIYIDTPFGIARDELHSMAETLICL